MKKSAWILIGIYAFGAAQGAMNLPWWCNAILGMLFGWNVDLLIKLIMESEIRSEILKLTNILKRKAP